MLADVCRDAEDARLGSGLSYAAVGRALRTLQAGRSRISVEGNPAGCRPYSLIPGMRRRRPRPGCPRISGNLGRARRRPDRLGRASPEPAGTGLRWTIEAPVVDMAPADRRDLRAWDALIEGDGWRLAVEAETRIQGHPSVVAAHRAEAPRRPGEWRPDSPGTTPSTTADSFENRRACCDSSFPDRRGRPFARSQRALGRRCERWSCCDSVPGTDCVQRMHRTPVEPRGGAAAGQRERS